jgi:hypothetical protein
MTKRMPPRIYLRPTDGESDEDFTQRATKAFVDFEQAYRREHGLPLLSETKPEKKS